MAANAGLTDHQRIERRDRLKAAISLVEQEMRENNSRASDEELQTPVSPYDGGLGVPELDRNDMRPQSNALRKRKNRTEAEPDLGYEQGLSQPRQLKKRKNSRLLSLALPLAFLLTAGFIGWSVYNSFVSMRPVGNGLLTQSGNLGPEREGDAADRKDWVTIFTAGQPDRISVQGRATAEIGGSGTSRYIRIKSPGPADTVSFDIGQGVLDQMEGKQTTFEVILRSDDGGTVQMAVSCDFGALGDCGRKRYDVTDQQSSLLFDLTAPVGKTANSAGRAIFTSDINGTGKSIDIYAIRMKTAEE